MCGICGELRFDGAPADLAAIARMTARLERRGPDHGGSYSDGSLGFGHRRLSIIDLSEQSNQPLVDAELGLALVFNGAIYNYRELRRDLQARGYHFFTDGDSEVILKAYREWGEDCPAHLHGMFAFAVWDMRARRLFLARDRFGIKPLYWSRDGTAPAFRLQPPGPAGRRRRGYARSIRSRCISSSPCTRWFRRRTPFCAGCASSSRRTA